MQKVALGRSMIVEPAIFLLDEPFSNLDAAFRAYMRAELKRIQHEIGQTMVYVTHDQVEAMSMADRIAVMDLGRAAAVRDRRTSCTTARRTASSPASSAPCSDELPAGTLRSRS